VFVANFILLTWYGAQAPDMKVLGNFSVADTSKLSVAYYFAYFIVILPLLSRFEKPRPLPTSISESVLKPAPATT
jgi:ubiquinol-cytochrome c reductase cytochrome b subunit